MTRINAGRGLCKWLGTIGSVALFASLFTVAIAGTSAAQTCNENGPADLQISAPTPNTGTPGDISSFVYRDPSGVGTDDFIYVTVTDVCGMLPASDNADQTGAYLNDFQVTFPSDTSLVGDLFDKLPSSPDFDLGEDISGPGEGTGIFPTCQYNPAGLFGTTNSVSCPVPGGPNGGLQTGDTMTLGFFVQLPVNQNSVTFTASLNANNDMPANIGPPQSWTIQITHPDLTVQFQDPNKPPATVYIGTGFNYNVTFENAGPAATPGPVSAVIQLPVAGLSSAIVNSTTSGTCTYNHPTFFDESRSVTCTFDPMPSDSQVVVSIGATSSTNTGYYTATATIDPNDVTGNEDPNNAASITTYVTDLSAPPPIYAPAVGASIPVGEVPDYPQAVAVDPVTGTVFAADYETSTVEVISESSQSAAISGGLSVGSQPAALAADPVSGTVYVAELPAQVQVIAEDPSDPADDQVTATVTVPAGTEGFDGPLGIAVLPGATPDTGTVYVSNGAGDTVSVISEATNTVTSVIQIPAEGGASDSYPFGVTADPVTGLVYVADQGDGYVSVISGSTLLGSIGVGGELNDATGIAADPDTGTVYVTVPAPLPGGTAAEVYVIQEDPANPAAATVATAIPVPPAGDGGATYGVPESIAVNPNTASVYVSNFEGSLDVINEDTADPAADAFNLAEDTGLVPANPNFDEVYGVAVDTSAGNTYSGTAYVVSDQTQDMYPVSYPPGQQPQSISFTTPATATVGGSAALAATGGGSGYPVTFTVDTSSGAGVCSVSGDTVSYTAAGSCVIDANQAGNIDYADAPQVTQTITVSPEDQSIIFSAPAPGSVGGSAALAATGGGSGNPVVFSVDPSSGTGVCSVSGDTVSYAAAGSCVIDANQAGNADYAAAPQVTQAITVALLSQSISFTAPAIGSVGGSATLTATGGGSGNPVVFSVDLFSGTGVCSVSGDTVSYTAAGSCEIDANQAGNADYAAASQVSQAIYVMGIPQSISFTAPAAGAVGGSATLTATGGASGNPVVFSVDPSSGSGVCSVSGTNGATVSYLAGGNCVVDANQAGNASYTAAPEVTQTITVNSVVQPQSISFTAPATGIVGGSATLTATGGASGNPVAFTVDPSSGTGVCSVTGNIVSYTAVGSCVIDANQAGDSEYAAAPQVSQTITVNAQLVVTTSSLPAGSAGAGYDESLTASGGVAPYTWSVVSGSLPPGLTLSASGQISGTATSGGSFSFTVVVTDSETPAAAAAQALTITVDAVPHITSADSATFTADTAGSFTITTTGYPAATLTEAGALPSGVTFASNGDGTATLSGTPAAGSEGTYPVTISAANSAGAANTQPFVLTVSGGLDITSADSTTATAGAAFSFTITASGTPAATLTHAGTLPSGVTFTANSNGTATLAGTPAATAHGVYPIAVTAKNSIGATSQAFLLTVDAGPAFSSSAAVTETAGVAFSYGVTTTAYPTAALTTATLTGGFTFAGNDNGTGTLSGSSALAAGTYSITITAANATASVSQTITLTVKAAGKTDQVSAFTSPATAMTTVGTPLSFTVTTAGSPTSYTSNVSHSGTLPAGVSFTNNGNGTATFSGTPNAAAEGRYMMTLTEKNTAGTTTQSFVLTVTGAPTITSAATAAATVGSALSIQVSATGSPAPAMTESGALPQGLTWADNGDGTATLAGTPTMNQGGVYTLTLTATNSLGSFEQTFTLTVDQAPAITSAATASAAHGSPFTFTVTTTGYPLATITRTGTVPGLTFTSNSKGTATLSGTPTKAGTYSLTVTAKNSVGSATQTFTLVVD
jgi:Putative Ig domain